MILLESSSPLMDVSCRPLEGCGLVCVKHELIANHVATAAAAAAASDNQNRNVFRPPPRSSSPRPERKVGFKEETEDIYSSSPLLSSKGTSPKPAAKASKWQPLTSVDAVPMSENDPFSLGDSDDEKDVAKETSSSKPGVGSSSSKLDDNERLKQAAAEAMADSLVDSEPGPGAEPSVKKD